MSLYKGTHLIAGNDSVGIEKIIDQKLRERDEKRYYIGSIIIDTKNINPSDYLGFGTWEYFGEGKCLVGVDDTQTEFNTVEKTGGEKSHVLTINELAQHGHDGNGNAFIVFGETQPVKGIGEGGLWTQGVGTMTTTGTTGSNQAHNNLQPYITVYIWKRIS